MDLSDLNAGFDTVDKKLGFFEKGFGGLQNVVGGAFTAIATAGVAAFTGIAAGMGHAVQAAADVEQQAANISAVFGDMAPPIADVKGLINTLALDPSLIVGVEDAGAGLQMLAQNGLAWSDIAGGAARSSILLANATGADLAKAADITTNAMGIFGLEVSDLDNVVATFTNAANKSQFTVDDWGYALANAGPKADMMGFKLEDLFAAMTLTSSGFASGQTMGTSWAWMINGLVPNTDKATNKMKELGLITADGANQFFKADGTGKDLTEVIKLLQGAFGGLTTEQQMAYSRTIFGQEAFGALSGVLGLNNDELNQLIPQMTDFSAVEAGAETRTNTYSAAMAALHDTFNSVFVMVGDKFLPILTTLARTFAEFVKENAPAVVEFFGGFADRFEAAIPVFERGIFVFEDGSGILMSFLEVMGMNGDKAQEIGQIFWDFRERIESIIAPIANAIAQFISWQDVLVVVAGVVASIVIPAIWGFITAATPIIALFAALVAGAALLRNAWENDWGGIRTTTEYVWGILSGIFNSVAIKIGWIVQVFQERWAALTDANATLGEKLALVWNTVLQVAHTIWQGIVTAVSILLPPFIAKLAEWGTAAWNWIVETTPIVLAKIAEWASALWGWITTNAPKWIETLAGWGTAAWEWIVKVIPIALRKLGEWGSALIKWLADKLPDFIKMVLDWGTALYEWIGDVIPKAINSLADFIKGIRKKGDDDGTPTFIEMVGEWATKFWEWITKDLIPEVGPAFMKFIKAMLDYGWDLTVAIGNLAKELGLLLWEWIVEITPIALRKLGEWGVALWGWIQDNLPEWQKRLTWWTTVAWEFIQRAIPVALEKLQEWGTALWNWVQENAPEWMKKLGEWAILAWQWIVDVTPTVVEKLGEWGTALWNWITENAPTWIEKLGEWAVAAWEWIVEITPTVVTKLGEWATALWDWLVANAPTWIEKLGEWATAAWQWIVDVVPIALEKLGEWGAALWGWLVEKAPTWIENLAAWGTAAWQWIVDASPTVVEKLGEWWGKVDEWYQTTVDPWVEKWKAFGVDLVQGWWDGLQEKWGDVAYWFERQWGDIVAEFKSFFGIASPSKLFYGFGENLMQGLANGISNAAQMPINAMSALANTVQGKVTGMVDAVANSARTITNTINNMPALPEGYWSTPTLPTTPAVTTPTPVATTPAVTTPNTVYNGGAGTGTAVQFGYKDLDLALNTLGGFVDITDTLKDIQDFAGVAKAYLTNIPSSSEAGMAISTLQSGGLSNTSVDRVLSAIQLLVNKIEEQGLGSQFNITAAPDASLQQQTELEELVSYLNALYG